MLNCDACVFANEKYFRAGDICPCRSRFSPFATQSLAVAAAAIKIGDFRLKRARVTVGRFFTLLLLLFRGENRFHFNLGARDSDQIKG